MGRSTRRAVALTLTLLSVSISAAGCGSGSSAAPATSRTPRQQVLSALVAYQARLGGNPGEGPLFCRDGYLGGNVAARRFRLYVWEACQQYRANARGTLVEGLGFSSPAVITVRATAHGYRIVSTAGPAYTKPGLWEYMFPDRAVRAKIRALDSGSSTGSVSPTAMFAADERQAKRELLGG
jgi:hypothetical protein